MPRHGPHREGEEPKPMMHGREKSDSSIVVKTPGNKPAQAGAVLAERREEAKGNAQRLNTRRTQSRESVSQQMERVRKAARQRKKERFTALLHHVNLDLLLTAYFWLKRNAAAGVDGVTWADYPMDPLNRIHASDTDLERYHLGIIKDEVELATLEAHLLLCSACVFRAEAAQEYIDLMRVALLRRDGGGRNH